MRRRVIEKADELAEVINRCEVCYVSMVAPDGSPYVVPMNFGFEAGVLYLHGAHHGKKMEALALDPKVCVAFSTDHELRYQHEKVACSWSMKYRSVLLYGTVELIHANDEKALALNVIMRKYAGHDFSFNAPALREVQPFRVVPTLVEGRAYGL